MNRSTEDNRKDGNGVADVATKKKALEFSKDLIKDKRYSYAIAPVVAPDDDLSSRDLEKVLSQMVMERQTEIMRSRTENLLVKYLEMENELKKKRLLHRFRAVVRILMMAASIKNYGSKYFDRLLGTERLPEVTPALPAFDVSQYRVQKHAQIPPQVKRMMAKPEWLRTEEELNLIFRSLCVLKFFDKYPRATLRNMSPVIHYSNYEANRVILRQGHMPLSFYFVVSGSLLVYIDVKDDEGIPKTLKVGKLGPGTSFGELAILNNTPRTATVTTEFDTELLSIQKDDFEVLLKDIAQQKSLGLYKAIQTLPEFNTWTKEDREHCSNNCKLIKYENNKVIIGNIQGEPEHMYFVVDGKCRIVESLRLMATSSKYSGALKLSPLQGTTRSKEALLNQSTWTSVVRRYVYIRTLEKGEYFGVGEDLQSRYVTSLGPVECLQIPHSYLKRTGHTNWLETLKDKKCFLMPSHKSILDEFMERVKWRAYKKGLMNDLVKRHKKTTVATMKDVPITIRREEETADWNMIQMS